MDIELFSKCLKDLLLKSDEVVVPSLGTFTAQTMPADVAEDGTPIPPYRKISYSLAGGEDDGFFLRWLAKYLPEGSDAATELQDFIEDLSGELDQKHSVDLAGIGTLKATGHKIYYFCCSNDLFQYPDVPGQESVEAMLPEDLAEEESRPIELSTEKWAKPGEEVVEEKPAQSQPEPQEEPEATATPQPAPEPGPEEEPEIEESPRARLIGNILLILFVILIFLIIAVILLKDLPWMSNLLDHLLYTKEELEILGK